MWRDVTTTLKCWRRSFWRSNWAQVVTYRVMAMRNEVWRNGKSRWTCIAKNPVPQGTNGHAVYREHYTEFGCWESSRNGDVQALEKLLWKCHSQRAQTEIIVFFLGADLWLRGVTNLVVFVNKNSGADNFLLNASEFPLQYYRYGDDIRHFPQPWRSFFLLVQT